MSLWECLSWDAKEILVLGNELTRWPHKCFIYVAKAKWLCLWSVFSYCCWGLIVSIQFKSPTLWFLLPYFSCLFACPVLSMSPIGESNNWDFSFTFQMWQNSDYKNHGLDHVHKVLYLVTRMWIGRKWENRNWWRHQKEGHLNW